MKRLDVRRECRCLAVRASTLGFLVIAACTALQVVAEALPTRGLLDPRVRVAPYSSEQVYHLYGFVGYQIDLEFEPGETFSGLAAGDIKGLTFIAQDNHLFLKPIEASDDGVHTRLRFNASAELPALFVRNDDASESLLNFSMDEGDVIVHRVARQFLVRRGRLVGCIVNKGFHGAGERLKSHTVSPQVERSTKPPGSKTGAAGPTFEGAQP